MASSQACCDEMRHALEFPDDRHPEACIHVSKGGAYFLGSSAVALRFCPWCASALSSAVELESLGFNLLEFQTPSIMGDLQQASMTFANGYEVRVSADMASSGWEFAILKNNRLCGTLPSLNDKDIYRAIDEHQVTELMQAVAGLPDDPNC